MGTIVWSPDNGWHDGPEGTLTRGEHGEIQIVTTQPEVGYPYRVDCCEQVKVVARLDKDDPDYPPTYAVCQDCIDAEARERATITQREANYLDRSKPWEPQSRSWVG